MEADGKTETRKDRETRVKSKMKSEKLKISQFTVHIHSESTAESETLENIKGERFQFPVSTVFSSFVFGMCLFFRAQQAPADMLHT